MENPKPIEITNNDDKMTNSMMNLLIIYIKKLRKELEYL